MVTADGKVLRVDAENHPDLFWAIRGGGGNFGVATRFQFRLHEVDQIVGGMLILPATPDTVHGFVELAAAAPEELSTIANVMKAPPMPFLPEELHGQVILFGLLVYTGDAETGESVVAPFRELATPLLDKVEPGHYAGIYEEEEEGPPPGVFAVRNLFVDGIDRAAAETIIEQVNASTAAMAVTQIRVLGGAISRVPDEATAFAHRQRPIMLNVASMFQQPDEAEAHESWVDRSRHGPWRQRRGLCQFHRRRGPGAGETGLSGPNLGPAPRRQAPVRPDQSVPAQPEHPASWVTPLGSGPPAGNVTSSRRGDR